MDPTISVCGKCGRSTQTPPAFERTTLCEDCAPKASPEVSFADEGQRQAAGARLRARYGEAVELASRTESYANLDWMLGARRNFDRDSMALDPEMTQLALLWLEDLARELDRELSPQSASSSGESTAQGASLRKEAAIRLRVATGAFADAVSSIEPQSVEPS